MQRRQFRSLVYSEAQCGMIAEALNKIFIAQSPSFCIRARLERPQGALGKEKIYRSPAEDDSITRFGKAEMNVCD